MLELANDARPVCAFLKSKKTIPSTVWAGMKQRARTEIEREPRRRLLVGADGAAGD